MRNRPFILGLLVLGLLVLCLAAGLYFVLRTDDASGPAEVAPIDAPRPKTAEPGLLTGAAPPATASEGVPVPEPTEDDWLHAWDANDGTPMGDVRLHGVVVNERGEAVPRARVWLRTKAGQPAFIDEPRVWHTDTDAEGRWELADTWANHSVLCAWAPGHERSTVDELPANTEIQVVLKKAPAVMVVVKPPPPDPNRRWVRDPIERVSVRVRLTAAEAKEHARMGEPLQATWQQPIELDMPTAIRIPDGASAHLAVDAARMASDPAFSVVPNAAKVITFQLIPSASIRMRLVDVESGSPLRIAGYGETFVRLTHVASGFVLNQTWREGDIYCADGVAVGEYKLEARYQGHVLAKALPPIVVKSPSQEVALDVPFKRDRSQGILHVVVRHAATSQRVGTDVDGFGPLFLRRREDKPQTWKQHWGIGMRVDRHGMKQAIDALTPGTYDILVWDGASFPTVGHVAGVALKGGEEKTVEIPLLGGYGYRPSDVVKVAPTATFDLRAESARFGVLPWVGLRGRVYVVDKDGFTKVSGTGYIGMYPFDDVTLVERLRGGDLRRHPIKQSIGPPSKPAR